MGLAVVFYFLFIYDKTKIIGQDLLFRIPGVGQLIKEVEVSRLGFLLGTLLQAGLPVTQALHSLSEASTFLRYSSMYAHMSQAIEE